MVDRDEERVSRGLQKMASGTRRAFAFGTEFYIVRGWRFAWTLFRVLPDSGRPLVREESERLLRHRMGGASRTSKRGRAGKVELVDVEASMLERVEALETELVDLLERLHSGRVGYQMFSGNRLEVYLDGVGYGVQWTMTDGVRTITELIEHRGNGVADGLARDLQNGTPERALRPVPKGLLDEARRHLARDGDVDAVMQELEAGTATLSGCGPTSDTAWQIAYQDGRFVQFDQSDRTEHERSRKDVERILRARSYTNIRRM